MKDLCRNMRYVDIIFIYTILIYVLYILFFLNHSNYKNCISLIIPSTEDDFLRCYKQFFYFTDSFILATEIIIVISSVSNETKLKIIVQNIKIKSKIVLALRNMRHYAASNRNYGFSFSRCPIISFFDMDDVMSINRLSILYNIFTNDGTTEFVLHKYSANCHDIMKSANIYNTMIYRYNLSYNDVYTSYRNNYKNEASNSRWCCKYIKEIKNEFVHNGWPTMRRYVMNKIKYNERYRYGQDSDFNSNVILNKYNTTILNISLGYYIKDNKCKNLKICN